MRSYLRNLTFGGLAATGMMWGGNAHADTLTDGNAADTLALTEVVAGLSQPTGFEFVPGGRMVVTEKGGRAVIVNPDRSVIDIGTFDVDTGSEKGLLNVVADPDFASNSKLYFYYSASDAAGGTNLDRHRVVAITLGSDDQLDFSSEQVLVSGLRGPANHDGGALEIGRDGKLYIGVGDTGCNSGQPADPPYTPTNYFGTCLSNGNGKILRVNLDGTIPDDNPFVGVSDAVACGSGCGTDPQSVPTEAARSDIWALGFRNPWRIWADPKTGNLWVGDVGEITWEEVNILAPSDGGKHYGWPWREGAQGHPASRCGDFTPGGGDCVDPAYACLHGGSTPSVDGDCKSITGGVIVDSCEWPSAYRDRYYFADNANGRLWAMDVTPARDGLVAGTREQIGIADGLVTNLQRGDDGDLYYSVIQAGNSYIVQLSPKTREDCPAGGQGGQGGQGGGAGSSGSGGTNSFGGAAGTSSAVGGATSGSGDDSGCGCRAAGSAGRSAWALGLAGFALLFARRWRA